jgi:AmmeMemoRadiSam system protein B
MGHQTRETVADLGRALAVSLPGANVLLVASTDLSHYHDAQTAARLDGRVIDCVSRFDEVR